MAKKSQKDSSAVASSGPKLLSGGNPQIPKADGDAPVQVYIDAMPEWKHEVGRQLDNLIVRLVPGVNKAVRWNTPFYGVADNGWFLSFHCFTKYIKLTFHNGGSLNPPPPVESKYDYIRYFHVFENDDVETDQLISWITQSAALPGEAVF